MKKKLEDLIIQNKAILENIGELKKTNEKEMKQINNIKKNLVKLKKQEQYKIGNFKKKEMVLKINTIK